MEKGRRNAQFSIAGMLLKRGRSIEKIMEFTEFSRDRILALRDQ
jgi:hypothetical protein